jgi:hypothetical protein
MGWPSSKRSMNLIHIRATEYIKAFLVSRTGFVNQDQFDASMAISTTKPVLNSFLLQDSVSLRPYINVQDELSCTIMLHIFDPVGMGTFIGHVRTIIRLVP